MTVAHSSAGSAASGAGNGGSTDAALAEVTRVLASIKTPRMPDRLAARLDRALAAEAARRSAGRCSWPGGQRFRPREHDMRETR